MEKDADGTGEAPEEVNGDENVKDVRVGKETGRVLMLEHCKWERRAEEELAI